MIHFILYSRSYCHLCDDLLQALRAFGAWHAFTVEVIDVDMHDHLVAQYDELVPVLMGSRNGSAAVEICHYFLDEAKVSAFLAEG